MKTILSMSFCKQTKLDLIHFELTPIIRNVFLVNCAEKRHCFFLENIKLCYSILKPITLKKKRSKVQLGFY